MVTPDFLGVSESDSVKLSSISVTGYSGDIDGAVYLQVLNYDGTLAAQYNWRHMAAQYVPGTEIIISPAFGPGWFKSSDPDKQIGKDVEDVTLTCGDALWIYSPSKDYKFVCSGTVRTSAKSVALRQGFKPCGNMFPMSVNLSKVSVKGYTGDIDGAVYMQILNYDGTLAAQYNWRHMAAQYVPGTEIIISPAFGPGWFKSSDPDKQIGKDVEDVSLDAGQGIWIYSPSKDYTLEFPDPGIVK